ncbi:MAG: hypothetical protein KC933_10005 [Myxococcales bacterium]|nr:hypothetical protein [Myxococcales bacterium]MCB9646555.1 hypothetical protein [Deltaproteobacteria bacterium]
MLDRRLAVQAATQYLRSHPDELTRFIRGGFGLRFGVPLAAFRWLITHVLGDANGMDPVVEAAPPGLRVAATLEKMDTKIRANATLYITRIAVSAHELRMELRLEDVSLKVLSERRTIVSALINSGALDVSRPGDLVNELPGIPPMVVEAEGHRLVLDLMKAPSLAKNPLVRHILGLTSSIITLHGVQTDEDHLDVVFRALPKGSAAAFNAVQDHLLVPAVQGAVFLVDRWQRRRLTDGI